MHAIDTNVLIYRLDRAELVKQTQARNRIRKLSQEQTPTVLLWQVLAEFMRYLRSWQDQGLIPAAAVTGYVNAVRHLFPLALPTSQVVDDALDCSRRCSLSHWDSMIIGACKVTGVTTLYTEDMGAPVTYDTVRLVNPFRGSHEQGADLTTDLTIQRVFW